MNKVYRTIWNESLGAWVATSEVGKARGKRSRNRMALTVAAALLGSATSAQAAPQGSDSGITTGLGGIAFSSGSLGTPANSWPGGIAIGAGAWADATNDNDAIPANPLRNGGIAIGNEASTGTNTGDRQIALGSRAHAFGSDSLAIGTDASTAAGTTGAMALGTRAAATATNSVAIGIEAVTSGTNAVALGASTNAAVSAVAVGDHAIANGTYDVYVGAEAGKAGLAGNVSNVGMGRQAGQYVSGSQNTASGAQSGSNVVGTGNTGLGFNAGSTVKGGYNATVGVNSGTNVTGSHNVAMGDSAGQTITADATISIGFGAKASSSNAIAIGSSAIASGMNDVYIGTGAGTGGVAGSNSNVGIGLTSGNNVEGRFNIAMGNTSGTNVKGLANTGLGDRAGLRVTGDDNTTVGVLSGSDVSGTRNTNVGAGSGNFVDGDNNFSAGLNAGTNVTGNSNVAMGDGAGRNVTAAATISIGLGANASKNKAIAMGANTVASAASAIAIGDGAQATGVQSISVGTGNIVNGNNSGAFGDPNIINGSGSYAMGNNNTIDANNAFVLGNNVNVATGLDGAVVLGNNSTVAASNPTASATINGNNYNFAGAAPVAGGVVSVGAAGAERQIANVAAGRISASSTDAVNGSQLFATNTAVQMLGGVVGDTSLTYTNANGVGIRYARTNEAGLAQLDAYAQGQGATAVGYEARANGADALALGRGTVAGQVGSVALGSGSVSAVAVGTAGATLAGTAYTFAGATPASTVSVGAAGAERSITNVAAGRVGASSTDAVNGSQLFATNTAVDDLGTRIAINQGSFSNIVGDTSVAYTNANGVGIRYARTNETGLAKLDSHAQVAGATAVGYDANASAANALALGRGTMAGQAGSVALGFGSVTDVAVATANISIGATAYNFAGTAPASTVSVGTVGAERTITNVAAGRIGGASTDAVNGSQLYASNQAIDNLATTVAANRINYYSVNSAGGGNQLNDGATAADAIAVGKDASASVVGGLALGAGAVSDRAIAPISGNIPVGNTAITYNTTDKTLLGAVSVGNATAYRQVTNVADGTQMQDAVTVRQLSGALQAFAATPTAYFHANSTAPDSLAVGAESVAVGPRTVVNGNNGIGIGNGAVVHLAAPGGIALGQGATSHLADSIAVGTGSSSAAVQGIALGAGASVTQAGGVALGAGSVSDAAVGTAGVMIGGNAYNFAGTTPASTVSVGAAGAERSITNVAAGRINGSSTDAVNGSQLFATNTAVDDLSTRIAISEGSFSNIVGDASVTYTDANGVGIRYARTNEVGLTKLDSHAQGQGSTAVGYDARASAPNALALGRGAVAGQEGSVALGFGSVTDVAVGTDRIAIGGKTYNFAGTTPASTVSVGAPGAGRTITNVAAGRVSASSTDAVNGSQLYASTQAIDNLATTVAANRINYYSVNSAGGGNQLNDGATAADAIAVGKDASASVSGGLALGAGSVSDRAIAPISGNIPVGKTAITYNTTDKTLLGAVSVGNATAYRQLTNVADGTQMQDAVTVRQLSGALQAFAATPTAYFHANSTAPDSLAVGAESVAVGPRTVVNGNNGIGIGNGAVVHLTAPGGIALGQGATSHLADSIALGTGSSSAAVQGIALGAGATVTQAGGVALGSGAVASTAAGVTGYVPTGATAGQTASIIATTSTQAAVSVGDVAHGQFRQITGVAAGTQNSDAVNVAQLKATQSSIVGLDQTAVKYDKNGDGTTNYNSITMGGGAGGSAPVAIHNVANGTAPTDAVNVRQLGDALADGKQYTDTRIDQLQGSMAGVREDANAGAAGAMAMAGMPQAALPGRGMMAVGMAGYRGQGALSIGVSALSDNGRWIYKLQSSADSRRHVGVAAGVGFHW